MKLLRTAPAGAPPSWPGLPDSGGKAAITPISPCAATAPLDDARFVVVIVTSILRGPGAAADRRSRPSRAGAVLHHLGAVSAVARPQSPLALMGHAAVEGLRGGSSAEPADVGPRRLAVVLTEDRRAITVDSETISELQ